MAYNFNINTTQEQATSDLGLQQNNPAMTYVDFATQIAKNAQEQRHQEELIAQAVEQSKQARMTTRNKKEANDLGVNPELTDYLSKEQAIAFLMHEWNVGEDDPEILKLQQVLPEMVNRFTVQTLLRKRSQGLGKEIGKPFKADAKGMYYGTLDKSGEPVALQEGQVYQAYVTEDGKINYVPSGLDTYGQNNSTFKPVGITKAGETVSPTRAGQLIVTGKDGLTRPWDAQADGELQPFISPTVSTGDLGDVQRLQASLEQFQTIKELFTEDAVGPVQDRLITLSQATGVDFSGLFNQSSAFDSKNTVFRTSLQSAINDYIKAVTGAQMSEAEASRLQKAIPSSGKAQEAFLPALDAANGIIEMKLESKLSLLEAAGFRNVGALRKTSKTRLEKGAAKAEKGGETDVKAKLRAKLEAMANKGK